MLRFLGSRAISRLVPDDGDHHDDVAPDVDDHRGARHTEAVATWPPHERTRGHRPESLKPPWRNLRKTQVGEGRRWNWPHERLHRTERTAVAFFLSRRPPGRFLGPSPRRR